MTANGGGAGAVEDEHDERHRHEHAAEQQQTLQLVRGMGRHELGQEREEEDGQLRVEQVGEHRGADDARRRPRRQVVVDDQRAVIAPRHHRHEQQVGDAREVHVGVIVG